MSALALTANPNITLQAAKNELAAALTQVHPDDDQIIVGHVQTAHDILEALLQPKPALALVPAPASSSVSLYEMADEVMTILNTLEALEEGTPEHAECTELLQQWFADMAKKVDRVGAMLQTLDPDDGPLANFAKQEIARLQKRRKSFAVKYEQLDYFAVKALRLLPEPKRGPRKMEGDRFTLQLGTSERVSILNPALIPDEYQRVTVKMNAAVWAEFRDTCPEIAAKMEMPSYEIQDGEVKKALKAGTAVGKLLLGEGGEEEFKAGADLVDAYKVKVK